MLIPQAIASSTSLLLLLLPLGWPKPQTARPPPPAEPQPPVLPDRSLMLPPNQADIPVLSLSLEALGVAG